MDVVYQVGRWEMNGLSGGHCRSRLAKDECCRMPFFKCSEYYLASDKRL